ncbi:hypothetical protein HY991_06015 [Candidatus Micrarchaeota archaeon]|nr:hypothetical protein [Candidatus Micrarchaeota archaeon]
MEIRADLETVIDRLTEYVALRRRTTVKQVASALSIPAPEVERLALLLQESGLIEVRYGLMDIDLIAKEVPKKEAEEKLVSVAAEIRREKDVLREESIELEKEVLESENILEFMEKDIFRRIQNAEELIKTIESTERLTEDDIDYLAKEVDFLMKQIAKFRAETKKIEARSESFEQTIRSFDDQLEQLRRRLGTSSYEDLQQLKLSVQPPLGKEKRTPLKPLVPGVKAEAPLEPSERELYEAVKEAETRAEQKGSEEKPVAKEETPPVEKPLEKLPSPSMEVERLKRIAISREAAPAKPSHSLEEELQPERFNQLIEAVKASRFRSGFESREKETGSEEAHSIEDIRKIFIPVTGHKKAVKHGKTARPKRRAKTKHRRK